MAEENKKRRTATDIIDELVGTENENFLHLILVSHFSADSLLSLEDCEKHKKSLLEFKDGFLGSNKLDPDDKARWIDYCDKGLEIIERDQKLFEKGGE